MDAPGSTAAFLSPERLRQVMTNLPADRCSLFFPHLVAAMGEFGITTPDRAAPFLANAAHESAELARLRENLNYSPDGLRKTWHKRFPTPELAAKYGRKPVAIANYVYGGRLGNGPEASGDGWAYRGGGIFQLTGRDNFRRVGRALGIDLEGHPELIETPAAACRSACYFWHTDGLSEIADTSSAETVAKRIADWHRITEDINGGDIGLAERTAYWERAKRVLGATL